MGRPRGSINVEIVIITGHDYGSVCLVEQIISQGKVNRYDSKIYFRSQGEIERVLYKDHIKYLKSQDCWPSIFEEKEAPKQDEDKSDDSDDDLFMNTNRPAAPEISSSDTDDEEDN